MKIYTRKGDRGRTSTLSGGTVSKADERIRALGGLDEVNAALGVVLAGPVPAELLAPLAHVQHMLFEAGAALAGPAEKIQASFFQDDVTWIEERIDAADAGLPPLTRFILPGGSPAAAGLHWARTVLRRTETQVVAALGPPAGESPGALALLAWLNRLSDALFTWARVANRAAGLEDVYWNRGG